MGITCGIYATSLGLPWWIPPLMACLIFAGSAEFVVASMLTAPFNPVQVFLTVFIINARHLFYGLSMLERFRDQGRKRPYLIFAMCDESFSINFSAQAPSGVDEGWFMTFVSLLNQLYWVVGCTLGSLFGSALALQVEGVSFAMTALFTVILLDQWLKEPVPASEIIGIVAAFAALLLFGPDMFMIPAMLFILAAVTLVRSRLEPVLDAADDAGGEREDACAGTANPANYGNDTEAHAGGDAQ